MADTLRETKRPLMTRARTSFGVATRSPTRPIIGTKSPVSDAVGTPGIIEKWGLTHVPVLFSYGRTLGGVGGAR